jgi:putative membrane protein
MPHMDPSGSWWMLAGWGWLWVVLVVPVLVLVVALLVSRRGGDASDSPSQDSRTALSILEDRYARGEIDREEFQQRRHDLLDEGR